MTLTEIRRAAQKGAVPARVHVQVESASPKLTRDHKPYCELSLADACDRMTLRVWSDHPQYKACTSFNIFFFQAEDGIRDFHVTGVQTCALPISTHASDVAVKP